MTEREVISKNQLLSNLIHIGHGNLGVYKRIGISAAKEQPELFSHFIAWNLEKGSVRDSKVAYPVLFLRGKVDNDYTENAVAALCSLDPRNLMRAVNYHQELRNEGLPVNSGAGQILKQGIKLYLGARQRGKLAERAMLQHRKSMKNLFKTYHVKPSRYVQRVLFDKDYPKGSVFDVVANLKNMPPREAAGAILNKKIPFLIAIGAIGGIKGKSDLLLALIEQMSGNELIANTNALTKAGVFEDPVLNSAFNTAVERAKRDKRTSSLKAGTVKTTSKKAAAKLKDLGDEKVAQLGGIDGDWLVLGDRSGSMHESINIAKEVSALVSHQVKGKVYLVYFDTQPRYFDVSGMSLDEVKAKTRGVTTGGATSIGVGLDYILQKGYLVNGIIIVSDGGENTRPTFSSVYKQYSDKFGLNPTVYHIRVSGDSNVLRSGGELIIEKLEFGKDIDYYSLPNLIPMLKANRYMFLDEIMETELLTFDKVFKGKEV